MFRLISPGSSRSDAERYAIHRAFLSRLKK